MKILKNQKEKNHVLLEVELPASKLEEGLKKTLNRVAQNINIPGFRKGKAPVSIVEKNVDPGHLESEAIEDLISECYPDVLKEADVHPIDYPALKIIQREKGKPLVFQIELDVYPEVKIGNINGIKAEKPETAVDEKDILETLGSLQNRFAKYVEVTDRSVKSGDLAILDIAAKEGIKAFDAFSKGGVSLAIGSGWIDKQFDEAVIGMKIGDEKEFEVNFAKEHAIDEVKGKKISFKVKVGKISGRELEPLDDEFAKKVSNFGSLAELKAELRHNMETEKLVQSDGVVRDQLVAALIRECEVDVPQALVKHETELMVDELKQALSQNQLTLEAYLKSIRKDESQIRKEMEQGATVRAKSKVILRAIAKQEKIDATPEDLDTELMHFAASEAKTLDEFKAGLNEGMREFVVDYLIRRKALDFVMSHAKITPAKAKGAA